MTEAKDKQEGAKPEGGKFCLVEPTAEGAAKLFEALTGKKPSEKEIADLAADMKTWDREDRAAPTRR